MNRTSTEASGQPRKSVLAIVFYIVASLCFIVGIGFALFGLRGNDTVAYRESVPRGAYTWAILGNSLLATLAFGAAGVLTTYLFQIREYTRMIARRICADSRSTQASPEDEK